MTYLFDTSAWLAHYTGEAGGAQVQKLIDSEGARILVASVSVTEFTRRLKTLGPGVNAETVRDDYLAVFDEVVPIDLDAACLAADLSAAASARLPLVDSLIAAAACLSGATLVHRDAHFSAIPAKRLRQLAVA